MEETPLSVFAVHQGFFENTEKTEVKIANPVCTRLSKEDADGIAEMLNSAQEGVIFLQFVAQSFFPLASGGAAELEEMAGREDVREKWETVAAPYRKGMFQVTEIKIENEVDKREYARCLAEERAKHKKK